jgi:hypothetical protein
MTREPNITCGECGGKLVWANGQSRCTDKKCPVYWKGQGGMETLSPAPAPPRSEPVNMPIVIKNPTDL